MRRATKNNAMCSLVFTPKKLHIEFVEQDPGVSKAQATFMLVKLKGVVKSGTLCLNVSIHTFVWAIPRASPIVGPWTAVDAQQQFQANFKEAISSPVDLLSAISLYQEVLQYAGSEVNLEFGEGFYMSPSDMFLKIGRISSYNNKIVVEAKGLPVGIKHVDEDVPPNPHTQPLEALQIGK